MSEWKPDGYNSVSPYLICDDADTMISFLQGAFHGEQLRRFENPDGTVMHAEVRIDDTIVMVGGSPGGGAGAHIHLYVPEVEETFSRAIAAGAEVVHAPKRRRDDDDQRGGVRDMCGNTWWISSQ